jgi:hypothetical protein
MKVPTPNAENVTAKISTFPDEFEVAEVRVAHRITPESARPIPANGLLLRRERRRAAARPADVFRQKTAAGRATNV